MIKVSLLTAIACAAFTFVAHAEGGCPPGQVPQEGPGWKTCVPNGTSATGSTQLPPSRSFEERWVALATDAQKGVLGQSAESRSDNEAQSSAARDCVSQGGTQCKVVISARNGCISMAISSKVYGTGSGPTTGSANADAVSECKKGGDPSCRVIYNKCVAAQVL
jgi:hypothetical protein